MSALPERQLESSPTRAEAPKKRTIAKKKTVEPSHNVVDESDSDDEREKKIEQRLNEQIEELKDFKAMTRGMCNKFIECLEDAKNEIRLLRKTQKKPRVKKDPTKPCTFEIPVPISDQMCELLGVPKGTVMSRNNVTHELHKYCEKHKLMNPNNRRFINPNDTLRAALKNYPENPSPQETLSWLNIQTYLKHHYAS
jgi:chromatin remodeling complex protein RSC6